MFVHSIEPHETLGVESPHPIGIPLPVGWLKYVAFKDISWAACFFSIIMKQVNRWIRKGKSLDTARNKTGLLCHVFEHFPELELNQGRGYS